VLWITWLAGIKQLSFKTIKTYLAGLIATVAEMGHSNEVIKDNSIVYQVLRGIKRTSGIKPRLVRLPITTSIIRIMIARIPRQQQCFTDKLIFAATCTGTFGLLRAGEFVQTELNRNSPLTLGQISLFDAQSIPINIHTASPTQLAQTCYYIIHLLQSKADPFRFGADVVIGSVVAIQLPRSPP
jgi:hypothetical protein